MSHILFA
jgi:hypothetical protein